MASEVVIESDREQLIVILVNVALLESQIRLKSITMKQLQDTIPPLMFIESHQIRKKSVKMPGCTFQEKWLTESEFKLWVKRNTSDVHSAYCRYCLKSFDVTTMGRQALVSHSKGRKHIEFLKGAVSQERLDLYTASPSTSQTSAEERTHVDLGSFVQKDDALSAEILWCLKTVDSNYSFNSNKGVTNVFERMFPDSKIAKSMSCSETKTMYMTCFGLAPYFSELLVRKLKNQPFVLMFDESLNRELQKKQLDIIITHWDQDTVQGSYFTSVFLGHACATDLVDAFEESVASKLGYSNLVQLAMDGPNVNWAAFDMLQKKLERENKKQLINIGSCGLHQLHNAFRAGMTETGWDISHILSAMYILFHDVPARRDDFQSATESYLYPLQVCSHRWVENIKVCERAIQILPSINTYIEQVEKKKYRNPQTKSYSSVKMFVKDPFNTVKLHFTIAVAKPIETFLKTYQTDKPMGPFLSTDFETVLRSCMKRVVKPLLMSEATSAVKLMNIDTHDDNNLKHCKQVDIGFAAETELKTLLSTKTVSERAAMEFKGDCKKMLQKFICKIIERSPLDYSLLRNLKCLSPEEICKNPEQCKVYFKRIVVKLEKLGQIEMCACDLIIDEFEKFIDNTKINPKFQNFDKSKDRLDNLCYNELNGNHHNDYQHLLDVIKKLLLLSHGQASIERGFSVNKEISDVNMQSKTLVSLRIVSDHLRQLGGISNVVISKELLKYANSARRNYQTFLDKQQADNNRQLIQRKRKLEQEEVTELRKRVKYLENDIKLLSNDADKASVKAEKERNFSLVAKSNSLRESARQKKIELESANSQLQLKLLNLKNT